MKGKIANAEKRGKYAKKRLNIWVFGVFHLVQSVQKVIEKQSFMIRVLSKMLSISDAILLV